MSFESCEGAPLHIHISNAVQIKANDSICIVAKDFSFWN